MSIVVVNGQNFDTAVMDLSNKARINDWHTEEGKFIRSLKQDVYLTSKLVEYCVDNVDELASGYKSPDGLGFKYVKASFMSELRNKANLAPENFVGNLFIPYHSVILSAIESLSSLVPADEQDENWVWKYNDQGKIIYDYSLEAMKRRKSFLENFDSFSIP